MLVDRRLFSIGSGCTSSPLSFAVVLGTGTANAQGLFTGAVAIGNATFADARGFLTGAIANGLGNGTPGPLPPETVARSVGALSLSYAGGTQTFVDTQGNLNIAAAQGDGYFVRAGGTPTDIGNVALSLGNNNDPEEPGLLAAVVAGDIGPSGRNPSYFNLALNLGDKNNVQANGFLNSALNVFGDGNALSATGVFNNATNFFGDDNGATAANVPDPTANILRQIGSNVAFTGFGNGNAVQAGSQTTPPGGPLSIVGTLGVDGRSISQPGTGISIATPFDSTGSNTSVLATSSTQASPVRAGLNAAPDRPKAAQRSPARPSLNAALDGPKAAQRSPARPSLNAALDRHKARSTGGSASKSVSDRITTSTKKRSDTVKPATRGANARAASTPSSPR